MALGSSAPEILLSVISTVSDIRGTPSPLGPSTIVGSAAFNLLVITAVSIIAVDSDTPKKVDGVGVFVITSLFSLWAYIWLYLTLQEISKDYVDVWEAWLTLAFFFFLILFSFIADKLNEFMNEKKKTVEQREEEKKQTEIQNIKHKLRMIAHEKGEPLVLEVAQGMKVDEISDTKYREIQNYFRQILQNDDLNQF